jgi:hypothetical protein
LTLRALRVAQCGWSSLGSTEAIERIATPQPDARATVFAEPLNLSI